jgi:alkaline phosphatase
MLTKHFHSLMVRRLIFFLVVFIADIPSAWAAKNVILMISDGAGFNTWLAASMYQGKVGNQVYDKPAWIKLACTTFPLNRSKRPTNNMLQDEALIYQPAKAWDPTLKGWIFRDFAGYIYLKSTYTDSAAAGTAISAGLKTYNQAINWADDDQSFNGRTIAAIAKAHGKSVGVITSVPWSHATPATLGGAHNINRDNYSAIAKEMLNASWLDVIMGAGHPDYDDNGHLLPADNPKRNYKYVGGKKIWEAIKSGAHPGGWKLIEKKADFQALASGPTPPKVLGTVTVATTLQENRDPRVASLWGKPLMPFKVPLSPNMPALTDLTKAALNCLDDNPNGFYLMIEGGAVDWANHANKKERMIEEQIDFVNSIEAVVQWIETQSNWDDTLLILTADHECGMLWGPESQVQPFQPLEDHGKDRMPGMRYNATSHSNSLVPLFARGANSDLFQQLIKGKDPTAAAVWKISGEYIDNTDIYYVMKTAVQEEQLPADKEKQELLLK